MGYSNYVYLCIETMINKSFCVLDESCIDYIVSNTLAQKKIDENEKDESTHNEISIGMLKAVISFFVSVSSVSMYSGSSMNFNDPHEENYKNVNISLCSKMIIPNILSTHVSNINKQLKKDTSHLSFRIN